MKNEQTPDVVEDDEVLYRSVRVGYNFVKFVNGKCVASSSAFNDREKQPSVDRAKLVSNNPAKVKMRPSDGVLKLLTQQVRQIEVHRKEERPNEPPADISLTVDVVPDPLPERRSHAVIKFHPWAGGPSNFNKLKERLALLAEWAPGGEISSCC